MPGTDGPRQFPQLARCLVQAPPPPATASVHRDPNLSVKSLVCSSWGNFSFSSLTHPPTQFPKAQMFPKSTHFLC